jgi:Arc/MetJ family transcription regulator
VTKRLVDIDDVLLDTARRLTGAPTMKDTVNAALQLVADTELRRRHLARLESGDGTDIAADRVMNDAWR